MIKKLFFIATLLICFSFTQIISAQDSETVAGKSIKTLPSSPLVIRGGLNFSDLSISGSDEGELSRRTSFNVGVLFDIPIGFNTKFTLQSGLLFTSKGFKEDGYENLRPTTFTCNASYLEVPLLVVCHFPLGENAEWLLNAGPYFAYGIDGKTTYDSDASSNEYHKSKLSIKTFGDDGYGFNRFDFGLSFGTGWSYRRFYFGIQADLGLVDVKSSEYDMLYNSEGITAKNRTVSLNVSYKL